MEKAESSSSSTTHHQIGNVNGGGAASPAEIGMIRKSKSNDEDEVEDEEVDDEEEEESAGSAYEAAPHLDRGCEPDEANICEEEEQKVLVPLSELTAIKANLQLLNHQMSAIVRALNVKPCGCTDCGIAQKLKIGDLQQQCQSHNGHLTNGFAVTADNRQGQQQQHQVTQNSLLELSGESTQRGRRSKYCTPTEKKAVAEYVRVHGASAAAKKFNIPPAVAAYYHRRQFKMATAQTLSQMAAQKQLRQSDMAGAADSSGESERMPLADGSQYPEENKATMNNQQLAQFLQNTPHAYLRGRGRGRPKLIGDELDAELVEHIVKLKQQHNCPHLTASQALVIARNYISSKAAGILEEHGGQVKLKITWAMKLVTRVQEREREIQLGLPPGTLQNLPRSVLNASGDQNTSNANALDELLGQNLLNQQISNVSAILAAASSAEESQRGGRTPGSSAAADAAMLNAMLGMGSTGNAAELFGLMEQQQPGTSKGTQQQHMHHMRTENMETNMEEQDAAIRQLLASLQGEGVGTGAERQHDDGGVGVSEAGMDMATLAHQLTG